MPKKALTYQADIPARDILRQITMEHEIEIISGKISADHIHMSISYRPIQNIVKKIERLKA